MRSVSGAGWSPAVAQRQQRMTAEADDDRLVLQGEHGGFRIVRAGRQVCDGSAPLPLGDSLLVDAVALSDFLQAFLTMLYRLTDCRCRRGVSTENLAHSAFFHFCEKTAPSKLAIKHLG